uniref:Ig-like domain-containing protein n=1 Tax=Sus scrofa TaxID=9823 RepID=A0A8D1RE54_PIG
WTPMLPARLCLGEMPCDLVSSVLPGTLPKPTLWAEPGPLVTWNSSVTIWCQGTLGAQECHLYAEGRPALGDRLSPLEAGDKVKFFIPYMTQDYAGSCHCYYISHTGLSEPSDAHFSLGEFSMIPVASAHGGTYRCHGSLSSDPYLLSHPSDPLESLPGSAPPPHGLRPPQGSVWVCGGGVHGGRAGSHPTGQLNFLFSGEGPQVCPVGAQSAQGPDPRNV